MKPYQSLFVEGLKHDEKYFATLEKQGYVVSPGREKSFSPIDNYGEYELQSSDIDDLPFYFMKLIKAPHDNIVGASNFFVCYFGDFNPPQLYEYSAISTSESELYDIMRKHDSNEGILLKYDAGKKSVVGFTVYPFEDGK